MGLWLFRNTREVLVFASFFVFLFRDVNVDVYTSLHTS